LKQRNPLLYLLWLEWRNLLQGTGRSRRRALSLLVLLALVIVPALVGLAAIWPVLLPLAAPNSTAIGVLVALSSSMWTHGGRIRWTAFYLGGWVSTLPVRSSVRHRVIAVRSFALSGVLIVVLLAALPLLNHAVSSASALTVRLLLTCAAALLVGSLLGWWLPARARLSSASPSRPMVLRQVGGRASLGALAQWGKLQTRRWFEPRIVSRLIAPAMLILPLGTSANLALALVGLWVIILYLLITLRATVHVARKGGDWLRPTPLRPARLAWAIGSLPLLKQLQWTLAAVLLLGVLGVRPLLAARLAEGWLAFATLAPTLVLAQARGVRHMRLRALFSFSLLVGLERWRSQWVIPAAALLCIWQLRSSTKARI
jgi:hypothetical protein